MDLEVDLLLMVCALLCCLCGSNQHRCAPCVPYVKMRVLLGCHVHVMQLLWCSITIVWRDGLDSYRTLVPMQFFYEA
jgi:hypothetical protein